MHQNNIQKTFKNKGNLSYKTRNLYFSMIFLILLMQFEGNRSTSNDFLDFLGFPTFFLFETFSKFTSGHGQAKALIQILRGYAQLMLDITCTRDGFLFIYR